MQSPLSVADYFVTLLAKSLKLMIFYSSIKRQQNALSALADPLLLMINSIPKVNFFNVRKGAKNLTKTIAD